VFVGRFNAASANKFRSSVEAKRLAWSELLMRGFIGKVARGSARLTASAVPFVELQNE
jgi:hypothetical protein